MTTVDKTKELPIGDQVQDMADDWAEIMASIFYVSKLLKAGYNALVSVGFDKTQAFELVKHRGLM